MQLDVYVDDPHAKARARLQPPDEPVLLAGLRTFRAFSGVACAKNRF